ncbi:unnamed protein product [Brachionus calyciflorus]|uniref:Solute carrier family 25 member 51 n=1 Tax=Brachionus calyciflorus TaxID=104777 RepID=A0A814C2A8_9BILA|nr:unnamed protein product [Brachionus calyciflorus]
MEKVNHEINSHKLLANSNLVTPPIVAKQSNVINKSKYVFSSHAEFLSGYFAACASITTLFPLNKLIFRQILDGVSFRDAFLQLKKEGFRHAYRGLLPPLIQKSLSYSIMFGTQNEYSLWLHHLYNQSPAGSQNKINPNVVNNSITAIAGAMAGLTEAFLTPLERVQAVLQMNQYHHRFKHTWHVFYDVNKTYGFRELYRGLTVICLRNSLSNVVFFTSRAQFKNYFPKTTSSFKNMLYDFINGSLLGASISTVFYPLNVFKSHMQARIGGKFLTIREAFWLVYESRERNLGRLYKGVGSNFMRAIFAWGITNSAYEFSLNKLKHLKIRH